MTNLLDLITPTNLDIERDKFFASNTYNPTFRYIWQDKSIVPNFSIKAKYPLWEAIRVQDHLAITSAASKFFEVNIEDNVLNRAQEHADIKGKGSTGSAEEYKRLMEEALSSFSLDDIRVVITDESGFNSRPNHKDQTLIVSKYIHFEYFSMEGGVHHEFVHILRYQNGKFNEIERSQHFLPTEEGLASWCQDNTNDDNGLAQHAMEYVASGVGQRGSLRDVYNCMRDYGMSPELAWKRACRHKFGFVDTSKPGDILKPAIYYANEEKIAKLSTDEKLRLFVGKIPLSELSNYPVYTGLWPVEKISNYFKL